MTTLENLQAKIAMLQAQATAIAKKESSAVIAKIRELMEKYGLTAADIDAHGGKATKRGGKPGAASAAKKPVSVARYQDPKTGATWTGHGRAPAWIASAKDRSKYLVAGGASASAPATGKTAKSGNYVRGIQPALYADPRTGATWSGRGRAPAWIAGARDRSNFLIAQKGADKAETNAASRKTAAVKNAATKKATPGKGTASKAAVVTKAPTKGGPTRTSVVGRAAKKAVARKTPVSKGAGNTVPAVIPESSGETASA